MENKREDNENKIILGDFISAIDKMDRDGNLNHKSFKDVVQIMLYQSLLWIMGLRINGKRRTENTLSSPTTIGPLIQGPGCTGYIPI